MDRTEYKLGYMPFIDGLRAISILSVVGFHALVPGLSGGFVGVDVFFVISGYLIINQIRKDLEGGKFSIWNFYARRVLRILPVYIIVLAAAYLAAVVFVISPDKYQDFIYSAVAAPLMASNVMFYFRQGYFDPNAHDRPLLHTWTLSVEEQFYLVAPALLVLVFVAGSRRFGRFAFVAALALAAVSLTGSIIFTDNGGRNPAFYLASFRAWEFIAGGLIVRRFSASVGRAPAIVAESMGWAGLGLIFFSVTQFDDSIAYPSWRALFPVVGTVLVLYSATGNPGTVTARLLSMRPMVLIGLISYGWYLWHWPVLTYARMTQLGEPALTYDIAASLFAALLAVLTYRLVETPVRRWRIERKQLLPSRRIAFIGALACIATAVVGGLISFAGYLHAGQWLETRYGMEGRGYFRSECRILVSSSVPPSCMEGRYGVLIGDSHADAMYGGLARETNERGAKLISIARGGCNPVWFGPRQREINPNNRCSNLVGPLETILANPEPPGFVIITSRVINYAKEDLSELVTQFDAERTRVLLVGPVPTFTESATECVVLSDRFSESRERCVAPRSRQDKRRATNVERMRAVADSHDNVRYIDPIESFCDETTCYPYDGDRILYRDGGHLVTAGADRIWDSFAADFEWALGEGKASDKGG